MADDASNNGASGGGRSLGGGPTEPLPSSWTGSRNSNPRIGRVGGPSTSSSAARPPRFATIQDLASGSLGGGTGGPPRGRPPQRQGDDDEDDAGDDDEEEGEKWFAGGERSGISVENPDRPARAGGLGTVRDILRKAAEGGPPPEVPAPQSQRGAFGGGGHILGSDEIPSQFLPDPVAQPSARDAPEEETAVRDITFWREGFSIQDGPLMRYDDPANSEILDSINSGNAPPSILNVQVGQPVELRVSRRLTEDYVPPPKRPFEGQGNRLGSPLPAGATASAASSSRQQQPPGAFPTGGGGATPQDRARWTTRFEVDMSAPTTSVQIRLADGTRLVSRMNLTHTVGDIRSFINASRPGQSLVPYTIGTTFPNKVLNDDSATIQGAGLANSVIVQRLA